MGDRQDKQPWPGSAGGAIRALRWALPLVIVATCGPIARAVTHLKPEMEAPPIAFRDQAGRDVTNASLRERVVVLIFGELYHAKTREACAAVDSVMGDARLVDQPVVVVLVTAQEAAPEDPAAGADWLPSVQGRDPQRKTFGAYRVAVMPSVVIIDPQGRVVHAMAGLIPRFTDLLTDSLLHACGKLSKENLDRSLRLSPTTQASESELRAERIVHLARQLMRRGLDEMAAEKYHEALELNPRLAEAHLDLGTLLLKRQRLPEAEKQFRLVLADQPNSLQASLGLAFVQTLRGGSELDEAEKSVRALLARSPSQPRAHYLLGLIQERRGKPEDAVASFKKSSELLLERAEQE